LETFSGRTTSNYLGGNEKYSWTSYVIVNSIYVGETIRRWELSTL